MSIGREKVVLEMDVFVSRGVRFEALIIRKDFKLIGFCQTPEFGGNDF